MNILQIPTTFVDIIGWFNSLNIEFKVLIAIIAITLCMVLIYFTFKLLEAFLLFLKVIFDGFLKIFRISPKIKNKIIITNEKSETPEEKDLSEQERDEEVEVTNIIIPVDEEKEIFREEEAGNSKKRVRTTDPITKNLQLKFQ